MRDFDWLGHQKETLTGDLEDNLISMGRGEGGEIVAALVSSTYCESVSGISIYYVGKCFWILNFELLVWVLRPAPFCLVSVIWPTENTCLEEHFLLGCYLNIPLA